MKPIDHPDFFRIAAPGNQTRESNIRLDQDGVFWHEGKRISNPALEKALHQWISRHPDNQRLILNNGYDWVYFAADDAPFNVTSIELGENDLRMTLSDGSEEWLGVGPLRLGTNDALYVTVKQGAYEARFSRHAQLALEPALATLDGKVALRLGGRAVAILGLGDD